jgi:hypothetical protein
MDPSSNWTQIVVTLIKSIFEYLSRKTKVAAVTATLGKTRRNIGAPRDFNLEGLFLSQIRSCTQ